MIRIDRNRLAEDGSPIRPSENWAEKAKDATRRAVDEGAAHEASDLYRDGEVRMALEKLFYDKCAYCESRLGTTAPWEVEHYRPKKSVAERPDHPGYYWLAYSWINLYPACTYCNQRRRDAPRWYDRRWLPAAGKGDLFPLEAEADRAMSPDDDLRRERPLLIDPCSVQDDPEEHFTFDLLGQILPRYEADQRAQRTIQICHLRRRRLRDARLKVLQRAVKTMALVQQIRDEGQDVTLAEGILRELLKDDAEYAAAARAVTRNPAAFDGGYAS